MIAKIRRFIRLVRATKVPYQGIDSSERSGYKAKGAGFYKKRDNKK